MIPDLQGSTQFIGSLTPDKAIGLSSLQEQRASRFIPLLISKFIHPDIAALRHFENINRCACPVFAAFVIQIIGIGHKLRHCECSDLRARVFIRILHRCDEGIVLARFCGKLRRSLSRILFRSECQNIVLLGYLHTVYGHFCSCSEGIDADRCIRKIIGNGECFTRCTADIGLVVRLCRNKCVERTRRCRTVCLHMLRICSVGDFIRRWVYRLAIECDRCNVMCRIECDLGIVQWDPVIQHQTKGEWILLGTGAAGDLKSGGYLVGCSGDPDVAERILSGFLIQVIEAARKFPCPIFLDVFRFFNSDGLAAAQQRLSRQVIGDIVIQSEVTGIADLPFCSCMNVPVRGGYKPSAATVLHQFITGKRLGEGEFRIRIAVCECIGKPCSGRIGYPPLFFIPFYKINGMLTA